MTDVDLHPLPITPNDPLSIVSLFIPLTYHSQQFSNKMKFRSMDIRKQEAKFHTPSTDNASAENQFDMEILHSEFNPNSLFESALPSLKLSAEENAKQPSPQLIKEDSNQESSQTKTEKKSLKQLDFLDNKVIDLMPEETMIEINQTNMANLKLQNRLS